MHAPPIRPARWLTLLAACLLSGPAVFAADELPTPKLAPTLKHVLPGKRDLAWTKVPWRPTLWDAVIEAQEQKKPILLWAMNGHALACT